MTFALIALIQSVAGPPAPAPPPVRTDRVAEQVRRECRGEGNEIVVCARSPQDDPHRLRPLPEKYEQQALPKAEAELGDGTVAAEVEGASVGGFTSNRLMVRFKLPF